MPEITAATVKELRERTGAGMMDCKKALQATDGDIDKAIEHLRKTGTAKAEKRAGRSTSQGYVAQYIHAGEKIGVLVELNCETDFVARNEDFRAFGRDVAMHVAAVNPRFVSRDEVDEATLAREAEIFREQAKGEGKPENVVEKIVEGRLSKFYSEVCLLEQPFVKDPDKTVETLLKEMIAKIGENVQVRRFARLAVGE